MVSLIISPKRSPAFSRLGFALSNISIGFIVSKFTIEVSFLFSLYIYYIFLVLINELISLKDSENSFSRNLCQGYLILILPEASLISMPPAAVSTMPAAIVNTTFTAFPIITPFLFYLLLNI